MRFRPPWSLLGLYVAVAISLLLLVGPLSRVYFQSPLLGIVTPPAVPAQGSVQPADGNLPAGERPGTGFPGVYQSLHQLAVRGLRNTFLSVEALKGFLRVAVPVLSAAESGDGSSLPVEGLSLRQLLVRSFEVAGGVQLGQPWTMLAAELPVLRVAELPEPGPLAVSIEMVLPQWRYAQLLGGNGEFEGDEPNDPSVPSPGSSERPGGQAPALGAQDVDPRVLIYHTHGTETYLGPVPAQSGINPSAVGFTPNRDRNIVAVGAELARALQQRGLGVLHVLELFDYQGGFVTRAGAYIRSLEMLNNFQDGRSVLQLYPGLRLLIDLHRDAIDREPATLTAGSTRAARILFVVGTRGNPHWETNYCLARRLHALLEERQPGLSRGVMVRHDARFNQHLLPGSLLVEIGSVESQFEEAVFTARVLAEVIQQAFQRGIIPEPGQPYRCDL